MTDVHEIETVVFEGDAPASIWTGVAGLYEEAFASPPYREARGELREIAQWGPAMLAAPGGRLTAAVVEDQVAGFAVSERLDQDRPWQEMLASTAGPEGGLVLPPESTVILQELAVDDAHRGRGIARALVAALLRDRAEEHVVLSVFERASSVHAMYRRWGFDEFGTAPAEGGDDTMHLMHHRLPWAL
ncbi:GNAT family N-acetyltransferase [Amnibacterium endophyticum]|uniref:GNAT family N-acetyltransferase n=1 Tax=Amnibacterium endophyticum TaxID=2109337 RepID=A0ABW4LGM1_9MICO